MGVKLNTGLGGSITIDATNTASNVTATLPAVSGTVMVNANQPAFSAQITTVQTITLNVDTKIVFGSEYFDTNSNYDSSNGRFTPTVAGYYQLNAQLYFPANSSSYATIAFYKNGTSIATSATASQTYVAPCPNLSSVIYLNGTTDYVEVYGASGMSGTINLTAFSRFSGVLVRSA